MGFQKWGYKLWNISGHSKRLWEIFLVLSLLFGAVLVRIDWYLHRFTGVYDINGIMLQTVFQLAGILLLYFGVRNLSGRIVAVFSMAFMSFLPAVLQQDFTQMPENLYFFLFTGMLFLISCYYRYGKGRKRRKSGEMIGLLSLGFGAGYMIYLDIIGCLLLILLFFVLADRKEKRVLAAVILTVVCLLGFLFFLWIQSVFSGGSFFKTLVLWKDLYFPFTAGYKIAVPDITIGGTVLVCIGAAWYVFDFWSEKMDKGCLYVISVFVLLMFVFFGRSNMNYQLLTTFYWSAAASVGVAAVTGLEKEGQAAVGQKGKNQQEVFWEAESMGKEDAAAPKAEEINTLEENKENKKEIKFIENPLPLPKKHVKKTMDYRFIPDNGQMNYDVEVDENDDFDLM